MGVYDVDRSSTAMLACLPISHPAALFLFGVRQCICDMTKLWRNSYGMYNWFYVEYTVRRAADLANALGMFTAKSILRVRFQFPFWVGIYHPTCIDGG